METTDAITQHHLNNIKNKTYTTNDDGSISTVRTMQVDFDGVPTLIPSIWDGKELSVEEASKRAIESGIVWPTATTHDELRQKDIDIHKRFEQDLKDANLSTNIPDFGDELDFSAGLEYGDDQILTLPAPDEVYSFPKTLPDRVNPTMAGEQNRTEETSTESEDVNASLKHNEGFRSQIYKDTMGYDTIGYGHKLTEEDKKSGRFKNGISKGEAERLLEQDERLHTSGLHRVAPWVKKQPQEVQEVLKDMAYNMGPNFIKDWPQFARQIREGKYKEAADNMLNTRYAEQVGNRATRNAQVLMSI